MTEQDDESKSQDDRSQDDRSQDDTTEFKDDSFKLVKPKFGELKKISLRFIVVWTGGKPNSAMTGLSNLNPSYINPKQFRSNDLTAQMKHQSYRVYGLKDKYSRGQDLLVFQRSVQEHLEDHGLDTITYLKDPFKQNATISVINEHGKFDLRQATKEAKELFNNTYDDYDRSNSKDATKFLLNSVDKDLKTQLYQDCSVDTPFIGYWLRLIRIVTLFY